MPVCMSVSLCFVYMRGCVSISLYFVFTRGNMSISLYLVTISENVRDRRTYGHTDKVIHRGASLLKRRLPGSFSDHNLQHRSLESPQGCRSCNSEH